MKTVVSEKGRVTIPKAVRDRLGLRPGTVLELRDEAGMLVGTRSVAPDVLEKWRGSGELLGGASVDEHLRRARGPRAHGH